MAGAQCKVPRPQDKSVYCVDNLYLRMTILTFLNAFRFVARSAIQANASSVLERDFKTLVSTFSATYLYSETRFSAEATKADLPNRKQQNG